MVHGLQIDKAEGVVMKNILSLFHMVTLILTIGCGNNAHLSSSKSFQSSPAIEASIEDGVLSTEYRVFVTSSRHGGNLGGISGANTICQNLAQQAGLSRTCKALLGQIGASPLANIADNGAELYTFTSSSDKIKVANSLSDFIQNNIEFDAKYDQNYLHLKTHGEDAGYNIVGSFGVWSGISLSGDTDRTCDDWTSSTYAQGGYNGYPDSSPECTNPNDPFDWMPQMHSNQNDCETKGFEWNENIGTYSVGGFALVCTGDGTDNNSQHIYCISE